MNEIAVDKVKRKVAGSLKNCVVQDNWPLYESFTKHVDSLSTEILKHKKKWITNYDCYSIFYDLAYESILNTTKDADEKLNGDLWGLLGERVASELVNSMTDFFLSIPRDYDIYIPLPKVTDTLGDIVLNDNLTIVSFGNTDDVPVAITMGLLSFDNKLELNRVYVKHSLSGYCNNNLENYSVKKALSNFKITLQQGISRKLFKIVTDLPAGVGLLGGLTQYRIPKVKLVAVDMTSTSERVINIELPIATSKLISSIDINTGSKDILKVIKDETLPALIINYLRLPALLIENSEDEARRVKSAIEWCFDSYSTEDITMTFLQICFGLESVFGEDTSSESLTKVLADRCAYLIGSDIKGRQEIRDNFKELYKIRSKLVHGAVNSLGKGQERFLHWGRSVLEVSIFKEIKHLGMDS